MQSDSYHVPHVSRPRVASRRRVILLMLFLGLALGSYWLPMYRHFPGSPAPSLADYIRLWINLFIDHPEMPILESVWDEQPVLFIMLAHGMAISLAMLLSGLALHLRRPGVLILLIVTTTLIVGLSAWVMIAMDQLRPPPLTPSTPTLRGVYVGLGASLAAWITTLVAYRQPKSGSARAHPLR
jgi:hypothetical protein